MSASFSFDAESPHLVALGVLVSRLEAVEARVRAAEAERLEVLAEALDLAAAENERRVSATPSGARGELAYRAVRAEVASVLHQSERVIERMMDRAHALRFSYSRTLDAVRDGSISERHAVVIVDAGAVVGGGGDPDAVLRRAGYEAAVLEHSRVETPARLRPIARRIAEQYAQRSLDERHAEARRRRRVYLVDAEDGMSDLVAHLPAAEAHGIYAGLTTASRDIERVEAAEAAEASAARAEDAGAEDAGAEAAGAENVRAENAGAENADTESTDPRAAGASAPRRPRRTRDEIRADLFSDLLRSGTGGGSGTGSGRGPGTANGAAAIRARVQVVIPGERLTPFISGERGTQESFAGDEAYGIRGRPGAPTAGPAPTLAGYGPIDTTTARELAGLADVWDLVRASAAPGAVLAVDRYRPSAAMRRSLAARDQHCRFPGCRVPAARCDLDHTIDAAHGGATATDNLAHLCRGHHTLKHHTGWSVTQDPDGELRWTSPTGRVHRDRPPSRVFFAAVPVGAQPHADQSDAAQLDAARPDPSGRRSGSAHAGSRARPRPRRALAVATDPGSDRDPPPF